MDWTDRILSIANIAVQAMSVLVEGIVLVAEIGYKIAASTLTVCAWAGPILAIVGLVIMIVAMIIMAVMGPPFSPTEQWMEDIGSKFVDQQLKEPPSSKLTWDFSPVKFIPNSSQKLSITGRNSSTSNINITIDEIRTNITTGTSSSSLFHDDDFQEPGGTTAATGRFWLEASSDTLRNTLRFGYVAGASSYGNQRSPNKDSDKQTPWSLSVRAIPTIDPEGKTRAGKIFLRAVRLVIQGKTGPSYDNKFYLDVIETWEDGDLVTSSTYIDRK